MGVDFTEVMLVGGDHITLFRIVDKATCTLYLGYLLYAFINNNEKEVRKSSAISRQAHNPTGHDVFLGGVAIPRIYPLTCLIAKNWCRTKAWFICCKPTYNARPCEQHSNPVYIQFHPLIACLSSFSLCQVWKSRRCAGVSFPPERFMSTTWLVYRVGKCCLVTWQYSCIA